MKKEFIIERQGKQFVLYAGLLDEAHEKGLRAIRTKLLQIPEDGNGMVAICAAEVEMADGAIFTGLGDASPRNVPAPMRDCLIRFSETRAKARGLRDAVNVGVVALEEVDFDAEEADDRRASAKAAAPASRPAAAAVQRATEVKSPTYAAALEKYGEADLRAGLLTRHAGLWVKAGAAGIPVGSADDNAEGAPTEWLYNRCEELAAALNQRAKSAPTDPKPAPMPVNLATAGPAATPAQVKAIYAIGRNEHQMGLNQVDDRSQELYGSSPAELTKRQASEFIDRLRTAHVA